MPLLRAKQYLDFRNSHELPKRGSMRIFIGITALCWSLNTLATEYFLERQNSCTTQSKLELKCEKDEERVLIFNDGPIWYGKNPDGGDIWKLRVRKSDEYILVLENPVLFSGTSIIYIMKKTGEFYWSEAAYSNYFNKGEFTVRHGVVRVVRE